MLGQESLGLFAETVPMSVTTVLSTLEGAEDEGKWFHLTRHCGERVAMFHLRVAFPFCFTYIDITL